MSQKPFLIIPEIDVIKIIDEKYFNDFKRKFLSNDFMYEDQQLNKHFMDNPNLNADNITAQEFIYEYSEVIKVIDYYGDGINREVEDETYTGKREYNFYIDYLIPGIEKGRKAYLLEIKKSLVNADKFKEHILIGFFSEKKREIRTAIDKITKIKEFKKKDFDTYLKNCLNSILDKINSLEKIYLPSLKINLSLNKAEALLLFHALYEKDVFTKTTSKTELGRFMNLHVTYRKLNKDIDIKKAYDSTFGLISSKKEGVKGQAISLELLQRLEKIEDGLFDFLKNNKG
jgi:hypothetical protein